MSWVLTLLGIVAADRAARARALHRRQGASACAWSASRCSSRRRSSRCTRGETEYAIGAIPAGGYVKITGMNPEELKDLEPEVAKRAYYNQPPWKRIVVILAGPGVNIADRVRAVLGRAAQRQPQRRDRARQPRPGGPDARRDTSSVRRSREGHPGRRRACAPGDRIVAVDGSAVTCPAATMTAHQLAPLRGRAQARAAAAPRP